MPGSDEGRRCQQAVLCRSICPRVRVIVSSASVWWFERTILAGKDPVQCGAGSKLAEICAVMPDVVDDY